MDDLDRLIAEREATDPEYKRLREETKPQLEFRRALIGARLAAGLTQKELAAKMDTKQSAIARLEAGTRAPNLDTLLRLAVVLGVDFVAGANGEITTQPHRAA